MLTTILFTLTACGLIHWILRKEHIVKRDAIWLDQCFGDDQMNITIARIYWEIVLLILGGSLLFLLILLGTGWRQ